MNRPFGGDDFLSLWAASVGCWLVAALLGLLLANA